MSETIKPTPAVILEEFPKGCFLGIEFLPGGVEKGIEMFESIFKENDIIAIPRTWEVKTSDDGDEKPLWISWTINQGLPHEPDILPMLLKEDKIVSYRYLEHPIMSETEKLKPAEILEKFPNGCLLEISFPYGEVEKGVELFENVFNENDIVATPRTWRFDADTEDGSRYLLISWTINQSFPNIFRKLMDDNKIVSYRYMVLTKEDVLANWIR